MVKSEKIQYFSIKSYDVDVILIHIQNIFYGELTIIEVKTLVFCENFMGTETFT